MPINDTLDVTPALYLQQMEYIMLMERDGESREVYMNYLQFTGNEGEMLKLIRLIRSVKDEHMEDLDPNSSRFYVSDVPIPEAIVDMHLGLVFGDDVPNPYYKYSGVFTCPSFLKKDKVEDNEDGYEDNDEPNEDEDDEDDDKEEPPQKDELDMDLDEGLQEVDEAECAYRLSHYFSADGFRKYFIKPSD